ncbi:DUF5655 domain-containing protein [Butyricimonas paravirosa]|uniref:DUF5655 domain-containing protein n=1 Tax=Butyricimonas paravirosa TaxID=1472417 RepID=UPI00210A41BF|nr:DUF5655 domain-containing protein [Butyricimonas paravirosa]
MDWSVFVASDFTENQIEATNFKDIAIELYQVKRYGEYLLISPIQKSQGAASIKPITQKTKELKNVTEEIEVYTEERLLVNKSDKIISLYEKYRTVILNLTDNIEVKPQKWYIAFKKNRRNICDVEIQKIGLKITINIKKGELDDPKNITRNISEVGHLGNGDYELKVSDNKNLEYVMSLIKQTITE